MEIFCEDKLKISVRNLVEFILRSGNLDNRRTTAADKNAMQEGSKIHRKIQKRMGSEYIAEVPLKMQFDYEKIIIEVEGRADGIIQGDVVTIDEIKGVYRPIESIKKPVEEHKAQAKCYGYIYCVQQQLTEINIQITYCNIETEEINRFQEHYSYDELAEWFELLMKEFYKWAEFMYDSKQQRNKSIKAMEFPFEYRDGQRDIVVSTYKAIKLGKELYIQAPTGVGKTMSTIFPTLKAVGENQADKVFYLTAKTITRTVARESYNILRRLGLKFKSIVITAKDKMCIMDETECNPQYCQRALGHFDRVNDAVYDIITNEEDITGEMIAEYAQKHRVCPYELSLDVSNWVDGIICDYNYVYDPTVKLKRYFGENNKGKYVCLVDEAHNLVERAREMYSATLYKDMFSNVKEIMFLRSNAIYNALEKCEARMLEYKRECEQYKVLEHIDEITHYLVRLNSLLTDYLEDNHDFDGRKQVLEFYFELMNFNYIYENIDDQYRNYCILESNGRFALRLFCVNPSNNLSMCMKQSVSTIFFSATFLPITYYKELLSGEKNDYAIYVMSPFAKENRLLLMGTDVSSKYTRRSESEYKRMFEYIKKIYSARKGNYMVFVPSYKMMDDIYSIACMNQQSDVEYIIQKNDMDERARDEFLDNFNQTSNNKSLVAFCVLGGVFSEGIDLVNDKLIGSIIIGTGIPQICPERKILSDYFQENGYNGFDFAYRYPGVNKVFQAAGRVIRTVEDTGVIALLDERFREPSYANLFPVEWNDCKLVNLATIDKEVDEFWGVFSEKIEKQKNV